MVCEDVVDKTADRQVPLAEKPDKSGDFAVQRPVDIDTLPFVAGGAIQENVPCSRRTEGAGRFAARQRVLRSLRRKSAVCCGIRTRSCHEAAQVLFVEPLIRFVASSFGSRFSARHSSFIRSARPHSRASAASGGSSVERPAQVPGTGSRPSAARTGMRLCSSRRPSWEMPVA